VLCCAGDLALLLLPYMKLVERTNASLGREKERDGFKERTTRTRALISFLCVGSEIDEKQSLKIE